MSLISGSYSREEVDMTGAPDSLNEEVEKLLRAAGVAMAAAKPDEARRLAPTEAEQRPRDDWTRSLDADLMLREMADIVLFQTHTE